MSHTTASALTRASILLKDDGATRWTSPELLGWLNDARREISTLRPDLYAIKAPLDLVAGAAQSIPSDGMRLTDVTRNVGGSACAVTEKELLDQFKPKWQLMPGSKVIRHFMMDERYPTAFWVYPPALAGARLEIVYQATPQDLADNAALSVTESMYLGALVDYICYRCYSKDTEFAGSAERAASHYSRFENALTDGGRIALVTSPNAANQGGTPSRIATGG
jgi:hypothetical protein